MNSAKNLIAKQPILSLDEEIIGYELLFRTSLHTNASSIVNNKVATSKVLSDAIQNFGIRKLLGESKAFINVDRSFLLDKVIETIPKEHFVLEILEDVTMDKALVSRIEELYNKGYQIAIDDMDLSEEMCSNFSPILPYTSIVKIDVQVAGSLERLQKKVGRLAEYEVSLLAEKVETQEVFEECKALGFSYFQGYFFSKPQIIEGAKLDPRKSVVLDIIGMLQNNEEITKIVGAFNKNPDLTINLLKYMNASATGIKMEISSIQQAITLLGRSMLSHWVTLFLYSDLVTTDKNMSALMETVQLRAELMSNLSKRFKKEDGKSAQKAYLVGLLSLIDTVFKVPMQEILEESLLDMEIKTALLEKKGYLGQLLKLAIIFDKGNYKNIAIILEKINMSVMELSTILSKSFSTVKMRYS